MSSSNGDGTVAPPPSGATDATGLQTPDLAAVLAEAARALRGDSATLPLLSPAARQMFEGAQAVSTTPIKEEAPSIGVLPHY